MSNSKSAGWQFDNTYLSLSEDMYRRVNPTKVAAPALALRQWLADGNNQRNKVMHFYEQNIYLGLYEVD